MVKTGLNPQPLFQEISAIGSAAIMLKMVPEEESIISSNNLILFFNGNLIFIHGTNDGTELFLLNGSISESNFISFCLNTFIYVSRQPK